MKKTVFFMASFGVGLLLCATLSDYAYTPKNVAPMASLTVPPTTFAPALEVPVIVSIEVTPVKARVSPKVAKRASKPTPKDTFGIFYDCETRDLNSTMNGHVQACEVLR